MRWPSRRPGGGSRRTRPLAALALSGAIGLAVVAATLPAAADIWSWTDPDGVTHFTNIPGKPGYKLYLKESTPTADARPRVFAAAVRHYDPIITEASARYVIPRPLIKAVILVESNFDPGAVSSKGAEGLMQLMPGTAAGLGVADSFDPRENILGGTRYLRMMANRFGGDMVLTIAAYNAGPGAVERYGPGIPPWPETRGYVKRVLSFYYHYKSLDG